MIETPEIRFLPFAEFPGDPTALCELVYETLPHFYELFPGSHREKLAMILAQLRAPRTELSLTQVAVIDGELAGFVTAFPGDELGQRQFSGAAVALGLLAAGDRGAYLSALREHGRKYPPMPPNTLYIARLGVATAFRATGLSGRLMRLAYDSFAHVGRYTGYIDKENIRSQRFSERLGLMPSILPESAGHYLYVKGIPELRPTEGRAQELS